MDAFRPQVSGTPEAMIRSFVFKNVGATDVPAYGCMMLVSADGSVGKGIGAETESNRAVVYCKRPDSEAASRQDPNIIAFNSRSVVKPGKFGKCVIGGYPAKALGTSDDSLGGLRIVADSYSLESGDGAFVSVGTPGGESGLSYVMASRSSVKLVRFTLTAALAASGTSSATIVSSGADNGTSITVSDHAGNAAESGDSGIAWKDGATYWVIEIKATAGEGGSANLVRFTLEEDIDPTSHLAGATINGGVDDGETIEVEDWQYNGGRSGDQGIAWKDGTDYYIIEIKQSPVVRFTLTSALGRDRGDTATANIERDIVGTPTTGTVNAWTKGPGAIEGARGAAFRLQLGDEVEYWIQSVEPRATRMRGSVSADFETTDTTFNVDTLIGLNGDVDDSTITVENIHEWAGKQYDKVRVEWNQEDAQWEAYQIDCVEGL